MSTHLLSTKLYIPSTRPGLVPRPRLTVILESGVPGKLILVSAPAGFGKTTLIAEFDASILIGADYTRGGGF